MQTLPQIRRILEKIAMKVNVHKNIKIQTNLANAVDVSSLELAISLDTFRRSKKYIKNKKLPT